MLTLEGCSHKLAVHGMVVELACEVPALNFHIHRALGEFATTDWPEGFTPVTGSVLPYDESVVLRSLSPSAKPLAYCGDDEPATEIYCENERYWLVDDRWGLAEMNLLTGSFRTWVLPQPTMHWRGVVDHGILWPLAQLLRPRGLSLVPGKSIERDGFGVLLISPAEIEPELTVFARAGWKIIGQRWTALRSEDDRVAMLDLPGEVQRTPAPFLRHTQAETSCEWVDLTEELPGARKHHAFCDAVVLIEPGRRPLPSLKQLGKMGLSGTLASAWPIPELHPQPAAHSLIPDLVQQCTIYRAQLSRRAEDFLRLMEQARLTRKSLAPMRVAV